MKTANYLLQQCPISQCWFWNTRKSAISLVGWLVVVGAVLRVFPFPTFEIKSERYHLIAKNLTELWPDFNLQQDRELRYIWWEIEFKLHAP